MKAILRITSLVAGGLLTLAPMYLLLSFSYAVGEPPSAEAKGLKYFALPLLAGAGLGGGLLLVGLPNLVVGSLRPTSRNVAAFLLVISAWTIFYVGFEGTFTRVVGPAVLLLNAVAFLYFVYPAKRFSPSHNNRHGNSDA